MKGKMNRTIIGIMIIASCFTGCNQPIEQVEQWDVYEITLNGPSTGTPFIDVALSAEFTNRGKSIRVPGFYDGKGIYRIRFSPPSQGEWTYQTESNISELSNKKGKFHCAPPSGRNHGPLKIVNTFYLEYADGTPYYAVGTTAYQWTKC